MLLYMFGSRESLTFVLLLAFCSDTIDLAAFRTARNSVRTAIRNSSGSIHGNRCCCPDICSAAKPLQSKPSCHSSQHAEQDSPRTTNSPCFLKSGCNEKGSPLNAFGSALKDFLPESQEAHSIIFPISLVLLSLHLSPLNIDLPSPFHPPRSC